jgi:hypothetical protein
MQAQERAIAVSPEVSDLGNAHHMIATERVKKHYRQGWDAFSLNESPNLEPSQPAACAICRY